MMIKKRVPTYRTPALPVASLSTLLTEKLQFITWHVTRESRNETNPLHNSLLVTLLVTLF
jgi:hypothetical protein